MPPDPQTTHDGPLTDTDGAEETDAGPMSTSARGGGRGASGPPERRCIATMQSRPAAEMIRFVRGPDGQAVPDLAARLPGRGAWLTSTREAVELAVKKSAFSRAFRAQTSAPADLADLVQRLLEKRALDGLGMAKRSGVLVAGYDQVRDMVRSGEAGVLIEARDGAEDGRGKVLGLATAVYGPGGDAESEYRPWPALAGCFTADELGMALGRERVIHACLKHGRLAQAWVGELARLSGFRPLAPLDWRPFTRPPGDVAPSGSPPDDAPEYGN